MLLLQKPSKGWFVAPGGKMELGETVREAVIREFKEETGLEVLDPELKGIYTFIIQEDEKVISEWMMFTFKATKAQGNLLEVSKEGILTWESTEEWIHLPMAEGDRPIIDYALHGEGILYGTFRYSSDHLLLSQRLQQEPF
jgi:8-oxo-dGTP diphosphatase